MAYITDARYIKAINNLKQKYDALAWYKKFWFNLWSYRLSSTLSKLNKTNPTTEEVEALLQQSRKSWFFSSIFGLLTEFKHAVLKALTDTLKEEEEEDKISQAPDKLANTGIINDLCTQNLTTLTQPSTNSPPLFQPITDLHKFLYSVTRGEYDNVTKMLKKDIKLLTRRKIISDCSERHFKSISGFELALWYLDSRMWSIMLEIVSQSDLNEEMTQELVAQYNRVKDKGVSYTFNGQMYNEPHFDFSNTIVKELEIQYDMVVTNRGPYQNYKWVNSDKQFVNGVGRAQRLLPVHCVSEYYNSINPNSRKQDRAQTKIVSFHKDNPTHNYDLFYLCDWYHPQLGITFGITTFGGDGFYPSNGYGTYANPPKKEIDFFKELGKRRIQEFVELEMKLERIPLRMLATM